MLCKAEGYSLLDLAVLFLLRKETYGVENWLGISMDCNGKVVLEIKGTNMR